jgi:hypothetical protein
MSARHPAGGPIKDPIKRHYSAAEAIVFALESAWPCKK